jgi:hypothetical protein
VCESEVVLLVDERQIDFVADEQGVCEEVDRTHAHQVLRDEGEKQGFRKFIDKNMKIGCRIYSRCRVR